MKTKKEYQSLGEFLLEYRKSKAMTQAQFAEKIGTTRSRYTRIETGKIKVGLATVAGIAAATKKSTAFINALNEKNTERK